MAKRKIESELYSYGLYTRWDNGSGKLPKIVDITNQIAVVEGIEFGYVLKIKGAKGKTVEYCIDHPVMVDEKGDEMPSFTGSYFINSNEFDFFLGDTVWQPFEQMQGAWLLTTWCDGVILAQKKFQLFVP